ncbi:MAG: hypothetical protein P0Y65_13540 [Candidatus Devosia phytovorans]|uniref:Uncharacterized protein n=1 Tax=Candidatus Devosia phytovorans TaxID=3121372 RepID=A0AAJ5VS39_9HYPH|nr:hypothetical protein [Devosia sp.]WEK03222.1 MAG: hypothetical protein P0Y65_13540 [Devosia sp.]
MAEEYLVTKLEGRWHICSADVVMGPYISQFAAETAAILAAKQDFRFGIAARVKVVTGSAVVIFDNQSPPSGHLP